MCPVGADSEGQRNTPPAGESKTERKVGGTRAPQEHEQYGTSTHLPIRQKKVRTGFGTGVTAGKMKWFAQECACEFFFFNNCKWSIQKHGYLLSGASKKKWTYIDDVRQPGHKESSNHGCGVQTRRKQWNVLKSPALGMLGRLGMERMIFCLTSNKCRAKERNLQLLIMWWKCSLNIAGLLFVFVFLGSYSV